MRELRIVFMGSPEFAVPSLEILVANKYHIVAVITAPYLDSVINIVGFWGGYEGSYRFMVRININVTRLLLAQFQ